MTDTDMTRHADFSAIDIWTGRWRWNTETSKFTDPLHKTPYKEQISEKRVSNGRLFNRNTRVFHDGRRREWVYDGAFDGQPRPIIWTDTQAVLTVIAFCQLGPLRGGDAYATPDGHVSGAEHFTIGKDNYKVWGSQTIEGKQYPYFEEWDRIG